MHIYLYIYISFMALRCEARLEGGATRRVFQPKEQVHHVRLADVEGEMTLDKEQDKQM